MSSSSSSYELQRASQAITFLLSKCVPEHGAVFEEVSEEDMQPGDIILFPFDYSCGHLIPVFKHAGVYCGEGEVIHFQGEGPNGLVIREGFNVMKKKRGKCWIWRKKGGINLSSFRRKVREAMNSEAPYSLSTNNCIHFALHLLGLSDFYHKGVILNPSERQLLALPAGNPQ